MIAVTSPVIKVNATKDELFNFFSNPSQTAKIIEHTSVRHLQVTEDGFSFLLKRAALFKFKVKTQYPSDIIYNSNKDVSFQTLLIFKIVEDGGVVIEFESDTSIFMDYFFEKRVDKWLNAVAQNIIQKFQ
jgi:hypothetical protein